MKSHCYRTEIFCRYDSMGNTSDAISVGRSSSERLPFGFAVVLAGLSA